MAMFNIAEKGEWPARKLGHSCDSVMLFQHVWKKPNSSLPSFMKTKQEEMGFCPHVESVVYSGVSFLLKIKEPQDASFVTSVNKIMK